MKVFANEIKENDDVDSFFLVKDKVTGVTKNGNPYLKLKLGDRLGEIEGRIWNSVDLFIDAFQKEDFVSVKGKAVSYQDHLQLNIGYIKKVDEEALSLSDFFPATEKDVDQMVRALMEISQEVKDLHLSRLLHLFWEDPSFLERFKIAPASKQLHHAYLGGLLEHTLSVAQLVLKNADHYKGLNLDLLVAGAILHDMGKVYELCYHRAFDYSDEGRLLGHIILGIEMLEAKISQLSDFPKNLSILVKHLLLSHHGQYLWGSPKKPMILEAVILHHLDDMDAKVSGIQQFLKTKVPEGSRWSSYHPLLEQFFYVPSPKPEEEESNIIEEN